MQFGDDAALAFPMLLELPASSRPSAPLCLALPAAEDFDYPEIRVSPRVEVTTSALGVTATDPRRLLRVSAQRSTTGSKYIPRRAIVTSSIITLPY
jgi:hypothetical protein